MRSREVLTIFVSVWLLAACGARRDLQSADPPRFVANYDEVSQIAIETRNPEAFSRKIQLIESARSTIDMAYYIYVDDFSSSLLSRKLIEKAQEGVKIRLLVDWVSTSDRREFFQMLMAKGGGNLTVGYFRPFPEEVETDLSSWGVGSPIPFLEGLVNFDLTGILNAIKENRIPEVLQNVPISIFDYIERFQLHPDDWFDGSKRLHHKLLLVDGVEVMGGGRNIEDAYHWEMDHPIRATLEEEESKYVFMDVDFHLTSPTLAERAGETFELFWGCGTGQPSCPLSRMVTLETAVASAITEEKYATLLEKASLFESTVATEARVHDLSLEGTDVLVGYAENRMLPEGDSNKLIFEESSQFNQEWVNQIAAVGEGEEILIHNAYVYFPSDIFKALVEAVIMRDVKVLVVTNSAQSSDLGFVSTIAHFQYMALMEGAASVGKEGNFRVVELLTPESVHAKVNVFGSRVLSVSSVNADPRSRYLDTQNGIFIQNPEMALAYSDWMQGLLTRLLNTGEAQNVTVDFLKAEFESRREQISSLPTPVAKVLGQLETLLSRSAQSALLFLSLKEEDRYRAEEALKFLDHLFLQL